ncbi:MAG: SURF1 family protein [Rhodosalinus sp.]|uniref:SURF1 family protein n=1 Tax=Rhodosalinus sp. TaxID=2047741 RepID=UPI00397D06EC
MRRFIGPLVIGIAGAAVLIALGVWQVQRLQWKEALLADIEARIAAEPVALPAAPDPRADRYLPVRAEGVIGAEELHVLVSTKTEGAGFRIVTPFETEGGRRLLLDRGFVPDEAKGAERRTGPVAVTGNLHWPDDRSSATPENDPGDNFWFARDLDQMAAALNTEPVLLVVRQEDPPPPGIMPLPVDTSGIPNDHLEYAVTWFGLAAVWVAMSGYLLWRTARRTT